MSVKCTVDRRARFRGPSRPLLLLVVTIFVSSPAAAFDGCKNLVGKTVSPTSFDAAATNMQRYPAKDEFETTEKYRQRIAAISGDQSAPLIILQEPNRHSVEYDADRGLLVVSAFVFGVDGFDALPTLLMAKGAASLDVGSGDNVSALINRRDTIMGKYIGTNAFGVHATITRVSRTTNALFDRRVPGRSSQFIDVEHSPEIAEIPMTVVEAKILERTIKTGWLFEPKPPFVVRSVRHVGDVDIDTRKDIIEHATVLIGDIPCGLLLGQDNKILAAFRTY